MSELRDALDAITAGVEGRCPHTETEVVEEQFVNLFNGAPTRVMELEMCTACGTLIREIGEAATTPPAVSENPAPDATPAASEATPTEWARVEDIPGDDAFLIHPHHQRGTQCQEPT